MKTERAGAQAVRDGKWLLAFIKAHKRDVLTNWNEDRLRRIVVSLLRAPEKKASKETLRLAALGREVERMERRPEWGLIVGATDVHGRSRFRRVSCDPKETGVLGWQPVGPWFDTPLTALRSARIAKKKGGKK